MDKANLPALFFLSLLILSRPRALFCTFPSFSTAIDSPDFHQWISVNVAMNELNIQTAVAKWTAKRFSYRIINAHCAVCYVARWRRQFIFLPLGNNFQQNDWSCYNKLGELWAGIINQAFRSGCALIWIRKKKRRDECFFPPPPPPEAAVIFQVHMLIQVVRLYSLRRWTGYTCARWWMNGYSNGKCNAMSPGHDDDHFNVYFVFTYVKMYVAKSFSFIKASKQETDTRNLHWRT